MLWFLIGLLGFLGLHSVRIVAPGWREARIAAMGEKAWKGIYSLLAIVFFVLMIWGYGQMRQHPVLVWQPPMALRHVGMLLVVIAFVLIVAAYVPNNAIRARLGHPMILGVKTWAFAHLLMSGWLHSMLLFGAFLLWAIIGFSDMRKRPREAVGKSSAGMTLVTVIVGIAFATVFAMFLHGMLIGVKPINMPMH
ncbi:NnrU family protein [Solilutibacter silvestris]|uniref:NnrU family protein n=1 Tax=Solilutibacter silvestris TaxID=1645665 RepID=UPI003D34621B